MKRLPLLLCLVGPAVPACSDDPGAGASAGAQLPPPTRIERAADPRVAALRDALDRGELDLAESLWPRVRALVDGVEHELLAARIAALAGDDLDASRHVESARRIDARDPRVCATAAELAAWGGRPETADLELAQAQQAFGAAAAIPELLRARGVVLICRQGGARPGLASLEEAVELDPALPFVGRALGQAHLLVGKSYAGSQPKLALEHARASVEYDDGDVDAQRFLGEMLMAIGEWGVGIRVFEELVANGEPLTGELATYCKNAGFWGLASDQRELGIEYLLRARELGLADEHMGETALLALGEEALLAVEAARQANDAGEVEAAEERLAHALACVPGFDPARAELASCCVARGVAALENAEERSLDDAAAAAIEEFQRALEHDPGSLEAHHFLGRALYRAGRYAEAVDQFHWVVDTARLERIALPEPVHIHLARALLLADREHGVEEAHEVLGAYLVLEGGGPWIEETRRFQAGLPDPRPDDDRR
jgi:tetratricopeptide (TPR) repeat protein